jgi:hypothetical protein
MKMYVYMYAMVHLIAKVTRKEAVVYHFRICLFILFHLHIDFLYQYI